MIFTTGCDSNNLGKSSRDGIIDKTVSIGNQIWMAENLNVDKFRNGDLIPEAKTNSEWKNIAFTNDFAKILSNDGDFNDLAELIRIVKKSDKDLLWIDEYICKIFNSNNF